MISVEAPPFVIKAVHFELRLASSKGSFQFDCSAIAATDPSPTIAAVEPSSTAKRKASVQSPVSTNFPHFEGSKTAKARTGFGFILYSVLTSPTIVMGAVGISSIIIIIEFLGLRPHWLHLKTSGFGASE